MAIPGAGVQPVGKIRIGEKTGRAARSLNYFRSDEPLFAELAGDQPHSLEIVFTTEEAWDSGLEWWAGTKTGNTLACYTKDAGADPIALRLEPFLDPDNVKRGEKRGSNRFPISCPFRQCIHFQKKQCRPVGRATFYLASDPEKRPWRLDTKSWNSIENIEKARANDPGRYVWNLSVAFESKGNKRFPVLSLEPTVLVTSKNVEDADMIVFLTKSVEKGEARLALAAYLDATRPGWQNEPDLIERIKEIGPEQAARNIIKRAHDA